MNLESDLNIQQNLAFLLFDEVVTLLAVYFSERVMQSTVSF